MKRIFALALLSMALTACDSTTTTENGNSNAAPRATATTTPAATPEASPSAAAQFKAGDKVKVNANGNLVAATIVSIDEKGGKVTIRIEGEKQDKTVGIADVNKP